MRALSQQIAQRVDFKPKHSRSKQNCIGEFPELTAYKFTQTHTSWHSLTSVVCLRVCVEMARTKTAAANAAQCRRGKSGSIKRKMFTRAKLKAYNFNRDKSTAAKRPPRAKAWCRCGGKSRKCAKADYLARQADASTSRGDKSRFPEEHRAGQLDLAGGENVSMFCKSSSVAAAAEHENCAAASNAESSHERVSINHHRHRRHAPDRYRHEQAERHLLECLRELQEASPQPKTTSDIQTSPPKMISSMKPKSTTYAARPLEVRRSRKVHFRELNTRTTAAADKAAGRFQIPLLQQSAGLATIVYCALALLVCCATCNCDTNDGNLLAGATDAYKPLLHPNHLQLPRRSLAAQAGYSNANEMAPPHSLPKPATAIDKQWKPNDIAMTPSVRAAHKAALGDREMLLNSLSESIERLHFGVAGGKSKFDAASETRNLVRSKNDDSSHKTPPSGATSATSLQTVGGQRKPIPSKPEYGLNQIMLLHEQAAHKTGARKTKASSDASPADALASGSSLAAKGAASLLRTGGISAGKLLKLQVSRNSSKVLSHLKSYVSPKRLSGTDSQDQTSAAGSSPTSSFTARANAKTLILGPILGLGQMLMAQAAPSQPSKRPLLTNQSNFQSHQTKAASPPQPLATSSPALFQQLKNHQLSPPVNQLVDSLSIGWLKRDNKNTKLALEPTKVSHGEKSSEEGANLNREQTQDLLQAESIQSNAFSPTWSTSAITEPRSPTKNKQQEEEDSNGKASPSVSSEAKGKRIKWIKNGIANSFAQNYIQDSLRNLLTLSQLPILSHGAGGSISTAPSDLEPGGKKWLANKQLNEQIRGNKTNPVEDLLRYFYLLSNFSVRRKRDPLKALGSATQTLTSGSSLPSRKPTRFLPSPLSNSGSALSSFANSPMNSLIKLPNNIQRLSSLLNTNKGIKPRGVIWDMASDPTLAVTVFHLLERASVALPLGFLLMPIVHMMRHPLNGLNLGRILPARASHRSVDYEELAKRLDMMDKILSRTMRPTHREAVFVG